MANVRNVNGEVFEIKVGSEVRFVDELIDGIKFINLMAGGVESDGYGVVVAVEPDSETIEQYEGINPLADGANKVIYFDATANRHFLARVDGLELVTLN